MKEINDCEAREKEIEALMNLFKMQAIEGETHHVFTTKTMAILTGKDEYTCYAALCQLEEDGLIYRVGYMDSDSGWIVDSRPQLEGRDMPGYFLVWGMR